MKKKYTKEELSRAKRAAFIDGWESAVDMAEQRYSQRLRKLEAEVADLEAEIAALEDKYSYGESMLPIDPTDLILEGWDDAAIETADVAEYDAAVNMAAQRRLREGAHDQV